ncbi:hypothetical protein GJAV_G00091090 [Gymnothorax javanicus]|nr:hypothetical protein GJAV_G00091090 [Gymnothorax javanicus]
MAVYGIIAGFIGAGKFFAENDTVRGAFTLTQSLHGLGEMTELNQQVSRMSRKIFQEGLREATEALGAEKTFAKISSSVERFGESAAGQFLKDIPIIGLGFQSYFIAEDSIAIQKHDRSDPEQNKYLGLKVTNLVLDVSTTVLTIAEVAYPPAAIVLEPIIIGLTIARMAIGDFYSDIVSELDQLPKGASDFDKMIAVITGLEEGFVDFVTGGMLRELNALDKEQTQNQIFLHNLSTPESYYKITANDGNASTLDLTQGILSQYGGFVTVQLSNDGNVMIQIGGVPDGQSGVKTIETVFHNPSIRSIALAVGESSQLLYTEKAAHLLWVIPVHYAKVICGEIKLHSSLFGTYYGNDEANQFFAPQLPTNKQSLASSEPCAYRGQDLEFVIKNYHYNIYGHGGDDTFFLGPQAFKLSGGEGRDLYIFPTSGTYTEIDNFSHDMSEDLMLIKAPFSHIDCVREVTDLHLVYGPQRYTVTIKDWFVHSHVDHYQHMKFQSADGVRFKVVDRGLVGHKFHANCVPESLDRTKSRGPVSIKLEGDFESVITVLGSNYSDTIVGNEKNNVFNGGPGADMLKGGEGADTYEIFKGQGCDVINNYAKDLKMDLVVLHVPFKEIRADMRGEDLLVFDKEDASSTCIQLKRWNASSLFQHVAFLSSDHVTFQISSNDGELVITALLVDLSKDNYNSTINLTETKQLLNVISVFDSPHDDFIYGNALGNFISCSGGRDFLQGANGSDKYVVKSGCIRAEIDNYAQDKASDVLFLEHSFENLTLRTQFSDLVLIVKDSNIEVHLRNWHMGSLFQHLILQTIDGVISLLPSNTSEPEVLVPFEINLSQENCNDFKKTFDFNKDPFNKVERFKAKSSKCSYSVIGNHMDNYIDPGIGNPMNYQYLRGGNGSDTYVIGHQYGYGNEIDNEAKDMKMDNLFFQVLYKDIIVLLEHPHVILSSKSRNDSVRVHLLKYLLGSEQQHLLIRSSDGFSFWVNPNSYPYKSVVSINMATSTKSSNISCAEGEEYLRVSQIYGATGFSNYITGSRRSTLIIGGNMDDYLRGNEGNERIEGNAGNDIINGQSGDDNLLGGKGDDIIMGGAGNDMIYGGLGADTIDGGPGVDVVFFSGDVRTSTGIKVDLTTGKGEWADAENDTYTDVEDVSGTNFDDVIIGNEEDNELVGKFGNDTLVPGHGSDKLFGGPGNDLYILDDCTGVKHINNFASDMAQDYILLRDFTVNDACFFLQGGTLVMSFSHRNPLQSLIQRDSLTVLLYNWSKNESLYQHVDFVFAQNILVKSTFFRSAEEIGHTILQLYSARPTLYTSQASDMTVDVEIKPPHTGDRLQTSRNVYIGTAEGNIHYSGWGKICISEDSAAQSFCQKLFPDSDWTARVLDSSAFTARYTYQCYGHCRFQTQSRVCRKQIQCRASCDPLPVPNGQVTCGMAHEGDWCSVSCNRLFRLQGDSSVRCRSDGWSSHPYCIETGECGYPHERGPHSVGCLTKLWAEAGCSTEANLSPTRTPGYWSRFNDYTVHQVRVYMESLPLPPDSLKYNPECQVDDECFPGRSTVLTIEGNRKSMSELQLGDRVLSLGGDGQLTFSEAILWLDRRPATRERYILLSTEDALEPLALSADHITFIAPSNGSTTAGMVPVFAKDLRRGHLLYRLHPAGGGSLQASRVTDVQESEELGAYAPMTVEGTLIVDGHLASCYALQCRQYLAHLPFAPYRLLHVLRTHVPFVDRLFPLAAEQRDEGVHWYAAAWHKVGQWFGYPFGKTCYPAEIQRYHYP